MQEQTHLDVIDITVSRSLATEAHVLIADGMLVHAPECALLGCTALAYSAAHIPAGWAWFCEPHFEAVARHDGLFPLAPV